MDSSSDSIPLHATCSHLSAGPRHALQFAILTAVLMAAASSASANYDCFYTSATITIDGLLDEPAWDEAAPITFLIPVTHEEPLSRTEARLFWDENFLYIGFQAWDHDVASTHTERDSATWKDDVLEAFLRPHPDKPVYYNFEINAFGTVYDAENQQPGGAPGPGQRRRVQSRRDWDCGGLRHAVHIEGTINSPGDKDQYWTLEMAIPFAALPALGGKAPQNGDRWEINLARYDYSVYLPNGKELSASAPLQAVNFHALEDYAGMRFVK